MKILKILWNNILHQGHPYIIKHCRKHHPKSSTNLRTLNKSGVRKNAKKHLSSEEKKYLKNQLTQYQLDEFRKKQKQIVSIPRLEEYLKEA